MLHDTVSQLRQLMSEALPRVPRRENERRQRADWLYYESNAQPLVLQQTPRDRARRAIVRIAGLYNWKEEISAALDRASATTLDEMTDDEIFALRERIGMLEECIREGYDSPDAPPAR